VFFSRISAWIESTSVRRVCVVGAAWAGLETAEALHARGLHVTLLELAPQIMPVVDEEMTVPLRLAIQAAGVDVITGDGIAGIDQVSAPAAGAGGGGGGGSAGDADARPHSLSVRTSGGRSIPSDLVILSLGTRVESKLAVAAGAQLGVRGSVRVDEFMRTTVPGVWAVGDAVETTNIVSGLKTNLQLAVRAWG
jgi:NADPH-dependent 2,4-dienoyl-CoA reductase/sulfur reductase-like enzyme